MWQCHRFNLRVITGLDPVIHLICRKKDGHADRSPRVTQNMQKRIAPTLLERFRAKHAPKILWDLIRGGIPVRVKKTRQNKKIERGRDSI
jgi:hypothetical protein